MNAIAKPEVASGGSLMPANLRDAMDLATMMSKGKLVPQALQQSPSDCLMVIEQSVRWGMSPFAVAQEVSVIQGKMMYSGKIVAAALHTSGVLDGRLSYDYAGENGAMSVTVTGKLRGEAEPRQVTVTLKDAKTANQHWVKSPQQMLGYHAARVWARRHAPEVMLGVYAPEEFEPDQQRQETPSGSVNVRQVPSDGPRQEPTSLRDLSPKPVPTRAEIDQILGGDSIPALDPEPVPDKAAEGVAALEARIRAAATEGDLHEIAGSPQVEKQRAWLARHRPELDTLLAEALGERYRQITEARLEAEPEPATVDV